MKIIFIIHLLTSVFMAGLCWFVQVVHYPLFRHIRIDEFAAYERKNFVTGYITIPLMVIELGTGLWLLYTYPNLLYLLNIAFFGIIGLSTVLFQVPIHLKLINKPTIELINKLILTNWIRTVGWSVRLVILGIVLYGSISL